MPAGRKLLVAGLASMLCGAAVAQSAMSGVPNAMQGFAENRGQKVRIESTALDMRDKNGKAVFTGGVKVVQGDTRMTSDRLVADYDKDAASVLRGDRLRVDMTSGVSRLEVDHGKVEVLLMQAGGCGAASAAHGNLRKPGGLK